MAIPTIVALNWLERSIERLAHEMEAVVTAIFTEDLTAAPPPVPSTAQGSAWSAEAGD